MVKKRYHLLLFLICFLAVAALWEWMARSFPQLLFVLPPPSAVFRTLWEIRDRFWFHSCVTLKEMCFGFLLALSVSFPLAWMMMRFKKSRSILQPLFIVIQCIPMFTLAPIMVVWLGWSLSAIVIPTALMIFFPLTLNLYQGLRSTPDPLVEFFKANNATQWQLFYKLRLPWALPHLFAGIRISAAIAGVSAIAGEWAGAQNGLGILMLESRRNADLEITFGALFCLTTISTLLYLLIVYGERIALPPRKWKMIPLLLVVLGCSSCTSQEKARDVRLMLDWLPNPNHIPLYVGIEKGFFAEEGISLTLQKMYDGGDGFSYLLGTSADLLINHLPGTLKACERGAPLKMVGLLIKEPLCGLIYRDEPGISAPSDLSGRRFGYCIGNPELTFLDYLLGQGNISPSEKKNVSVDLVAAMGTQSVDFIYGAFWNIEPAQLESLGIKTKTFKIQELGIPTYYEMIILAHEETPYARKNFALPFQRALQKSLDFCRNHPEEAFDCYARANPDRSSKTISWQQEAWKLTLPLLAIDQSIDETLIEEFYDWQTSQGMIKHPFDFQRLIATE